MIPYNPKLKQRATDLRTNMTPQERHLWYDFLRDYPVKIIRQKRLDNFIVDFYCHQAKLVIELDGSQHFSEDGMAYDQERTACLERYGLLVLRLPNNDIDRNFQGVCTHIDQMIKQRL